MPEDLDPVIHAPARLRVVASLAALGRGDEVAFPKLRKLEDAGYVRVTKTHEGRTPATYLALTDTGRTAFADYQAALMDLLKGAQR